MTQAGSGAGGELTTAQVADYLGVKPQTVYAYVSRGVLTTLRREPGTGSIFALEDVQALVGAGRSGRRSGRRPGPAASDDVRTQITEVRTGGLAYRGHDVGELVGRWSFEQVRELLVGVEGVGSGGGAGGDGSSGAWPTADAVAALGRLTAALPGRATSLDRFKHAVLLAGATDPGRHDRSPATFARAGVRAAALMALSLPSSRPTPAGAPTLAATLSTALPNCPVELLDAALVLLADHDLAVSTTAVRVAVSSGADPYGALLAGLAAADSPMHVSASLRTVDWLAGALADPQAALDAALSVDRPVGFDHVVYTEQDPRAQVLLGLLEDVADPVELQTLRYIEAELLERRGWVLNIDTALALLVRSLHLPRDAGAVVFACARTAGWTAHAVEELAERSMRFRLRGLYHGLRAGR